MNRSVLKHKVTRVKAVAWCRITIIYPKDLARGKIIGPNLRRPAMVGSLLRGLVTALDWQEGGRAVQRRPPGFQSPTATMKGMTEEEADGRAIVIRRPVIGSSVIVSRINIDRAESRRIGRRHLIH